MQNTTFSNEYQKIKTANSIVEYVKEAVSALTYSGDLKQVKIAEGVHLVLSYIVQLVIRSLCKGLMQIMTPEGLVNIRKCIPLSYLHTYMYDQNHFCLKDIIKDEMLPSKSQEER